MEFVDKLKNLFGKKEEIPLEISPADKEHEEKVLNTLSTNGKLEGPSVGETLYDHHQIGEFIKFLRKFKQHKKIADTENINKYYDNKGDK